MVVQLFVPTTSFTDWRTTIMSNINWNVLNRSLLCVSSLAFKATDVALKYVAKGANKAHNFLDNKLVELSPPKSTCKKSGPCEKRGRECEEITFDISDAEVSVLEEVYGMHLSDDAPDSTKDQAGDGVKSSEGVTPSTDGDKRDEEPPHPQSNSEGLSLVKNESQSEGRSDEREYDTLMSETLPADNPRSSAKS